MLNEILNSVVTDVNGLGLTLNTAAVTVVKRKGVKRQPVVDAANQITVCKAEHDKITVQYLGMQKVAVYYPLEITAISPNNRDWLTNLDTYISWFDSIVTLFVPPSLTGTNLWTTTASGMKVWDVRVEPGEFLEPDDMAQGFDVFTIQLNVKTTFIT